MMSRNEHRAFRRAGLPGSEPGQSLGHLAPPTIRVTPAPAGEGPGFGRAAGFDRAAGLGRRGRLALPWLLALAGLCLLMAGCQTTMKEQPKYGPETYSEFYPNHQSSQLPPGNTIAHGLALSTTALTTGKVNGQPANDFPFQMTRDDLLRGEALFNGICAECHDRAGTGNGVVVQRGFSKPPSLHSDALRNMPPGQYFDVITNGFGAMPPYGPILQPPDRWRVIAYIRALQLSQNAKLGDVPPDMQNQIQAGGGQ